MSIIQDIIVCLRAEAVGGQRNQGEKDGGDMFGHFGHFRVSCGRGLCSGAPEQLEIQTRDQTNQIIRPYCPRSVHAELMGDKPGTR